MRFELRSRARTLALAVATVTMVVGAAVPAQAQMTAFRMGVAQAAADDQTLARFYRGREFQGFWTGTDAAAEARRDALLAALADAPLQGLPASEFNVDALIAQMTSARTPMQKAAVDVEMTRLFLAYAREISGGVVVPTSVDDGIKRTVRHQAPAAILTDFAVSEPFAYFRSLPPQTAQYAGLLKARLDLEAMARAGGWGPAVPGGDKIEPGASGPRIVALRNRMIAMGYLERSVSQSYDAALVDAVVKFQETHGLTPDGVIGDGTLAEINASIESRIRAVIVAMERERWMNMPLGERHIWVNLADFTAKIIDDDQVTFETRAVVGANDASRRSPEFSDQMEYLVINPSWFVPPDIVADEVLPELQADPTSNSYLQILDANGNAVDRSTIDFTTLTPASFSYGLKQPPGPGNALGRVKFMFPNRYNIYLHDTPQRSLFGREVRAFSHGCIRLNDPLEFAYVLLARQTSDPAGAFARIYNTGQETQLALEKPIPVHIDYRTAIVGSDGTIGFRRDVYGRDGKIWDALMRAGVADPAVQG